jgi:hypothetical protein
VPPIVQAEDRIGGGRRQAVPKLVSCETRQQSTEFGSRDESQERERSDVAIMRCNSGGDFLGNFRFQRTEVTAM